MSMNTVIIAVIVLLILGIMIFILSKNITSLNKGLGCPGYGGKCQVGMCDGSRDLIVHWEKPLCDGGEVCCSIVPGKGKEIVEGSNGKDIIQAR